MKVTLANMIWRKFKKQNIWYVANIFDYFVEINFAYVVEFFAECFCLYCWFYFLLILLNVFAYFVEFVFIYFIESF